MVSIMKVTRFKFWYQAETRATLTPKYPRLPRSIYVQRVETVKQSGPWNSLGIWAHAEDGGCETVRPMKQSRYSWLSGGYMVVMYFQLWKTWKFDFLSHIWPWRLRSIAPPPPPPPPPKKKKKKKKTGILTKVFCTSGPNLVILAWMGGELWCGQAQNGVNLDFQVKFDLEGQGRSVHKK